MKKIGLFLVLFLFAFQVSFAQHGNSKGKILMLVSNPSTSQQTGWPIGFWWAELSHAYWEFAHAGYEVELVSPNGGEVVADAYSDPEHESGYSASDFVSLGFKHSKNHVALLKNTKKLSDVNLDDYKAIYLVGGQSPMYTFKGNKEVESLVVKSYEAKKPTAVVCHATAVLLDAKLSNGKYLVEGKEWTGFANSEEDVADKALGKKIQPFRIEDEARKMKKTKFMVKPAFTSYAIADGNLITGQQQNSGAEAARMVVEQLEKMK